MAEDWSETEVELVVADYFEMLRAELMGDRFGKTEHRRRLVPRLNGRSDQSVEFKHANISAVLVQMYLPYIDGYKPRGNYQRLLREGVEAYIVAHPTFFSDIVHSPVLNPTTAGAATGAASRLFVPPPERSVVTPDDLQLPAVRKIDFVKRDAENRALGRLGEEWIVGVEKSRLLENGRDDLANRVEWVSSTRGDGLGFDIISFNHEDDSERHVEVKTTSLGKFFPFYVSANELRVSEREPDAYHLYRVFGFGRDPKLFVLKGSLSATCRLQTTQYRAVI